MHALTVDNGSLATWHIGCQTRKDRNTTPATNATPDSTLVKTIKICSAREASTLHMKALKREEINKVKGMAKPKKHAKHRDQTNSKPLQSENPRMVMKKCHFCTQVHVMKKESCPAWGKACTSCGRKNHFPSSRKCKGRNVHAVMEDYASNSSDSSTGTISAITAELCHDVNSVKTQHQLIYC